MNELMDDQPDSTPETSASPVIVVRNQPVMLAARVAQAFGVQTREVIQAVKRNPLKFTDIHAFELTPEEVAALTSQSVISKPGRGGSRALPWVFTHKGVVRLATSLTSPAALQATDMIIDLFLEVHAQIRQGRTDIGISNLSRLLPDPDEAERRGTLRRRLFDAIDSLFDTIIDPKRNTTVKDELEEIGSSGLDYFKERLKTRGLENEKLEAETLHILEKIREIRARTSADVLKSRAETEKITLENLDKKIAIVERLTKMVDQMEPVAVVNLLGEFAPTHPPASQLRQLAKPSKPSSED